MSAQAETMQGMVGELVNLSGGAGSGEGETRADRKGKPHMKVSRTIKAKASEPKKGSTAPESANF